MSAFAASVIYDSPAKTEKCAHYLHAKKSDIKRSLSRICVGQWKEVHWFYQVFVAKTALFEQTSAKMYCFDSCSLSLINGHYILTDRGRKRLGKTSYCKKPVARGIILFFKGTNLLSNKNLY